MGTVKVRTIKRRSNAPAAAPAASPVGLTFLDLNSSGVLSGTGYHRLVDAPEVASAIWIISDLISSMSIHLMENQKSGDIRIRDQLARKVDVNPWSLGTRQLWMQWIVDTMIANGESVVIPRTAGDLIADLIPAPNATICRDPDATDYYAIYEGNRFDSGNILHFRLRPDPDRPWRGLGVHVQLEQVVQSILQTYETKTAYMSSEYKPPIVVAVNSDSSLANQDERDRFADAYLKRKDKSAPLIIPADLMNISQVKPLSLTDLAIKDGIELDKKTVASIIGVPAFLLGVGSFNKDEYNTFISRKILPIARGIEQELTKKLIFSESRYWRLNPRGLYAYSLTDLAAIAKEWRGAGLMTGNEARHWIEMPPKDGLDTLVMLENYLPADRLGDQKKLNDKEEQQSA